MPASQRVSLSTPDHELPPRGPSVDGRKLLIIGGIAAAIFAIALTFIVTRQAMQPELPEGSPTACVERDVSGAQITACSFGPELVKLTVASGEYVVVQGMMRPGNARLPLNTSKSGLRMAGWIEADFANAVTGGGEGDGVPIVGDWTVRPSEKAAPTATFNRDQVLFVPTS